MSTTVTTTTRRIRTAGTWVSVQRAAELLGISQFAVYGRCRSGTLTSVETDLGRLVWVKSDGSDATGSTEGASNA